VPVSSRTRSQVSEVVKAERSSGLQSLWAVDDVAHYLKLKSQLTVGNMVRAGRITRADGLVKVGRLTRFHPEMVVARVDAGLFGRGIEGDSLPVANGQAAADEEQGFASPISVEDAQRIAGGK
jgi:hypothetical protein